MKRSLWWCERLSFMLWDTVFHVAICRVWERWRPSLRHVKGVFSPRKDGLYIILLPYSLLLAVVFIAHLGCRSAYNAVWQGVACAHFSLRYFRPIMFCLRMSHVWIPNGNQMVINEAIFVFFCQDAVNVAGITVLCSSMKIIRLKFAACGKIA